MNPQRQDREDHACSNRSARRVLMIAYLFPPIGGIGAAGSQRVLKFAKYLPDFGWHPIVLTVKESYYEPYLTVDRSLLDKVPSGLTVVRTPVVRWLTKLLEQRRKWTSRIPSPSSPQASGSVPSRGRTSDGWYQTLKNAVTDLFEIPDEEMGWLLPGFIHGWRAIRQHDTNVIYSTGRPWSAHVIGCALKRVTGKPLVVDFRDPWVTNPFRVKYSRAKEAAEKALERVVIRSADVVIANTEELQQEFVRRFTAEPKEKFQQILNGFDPDDYPDLDAASLRSPHVFRITHAGFLYGERDPRSFLQAFRMVLERLPTERRRIETHFIGNTSLSYGLEDYLRTNDLADVVRLQEHLPYRESLDRLRSASLLLLLQPGTRTQIPSKLFDYIAMRKPILAITPPEGATGRLIAEEGMGTVVDPNDLSGIADAIEARYQSWNSSSDVADSNPGRWDRFSVKRMTGALAEILESCDPSR